MVTNARSDELDLTVDRCHALEAEVARLTAQLEAVSAELMDERSHSASLKRVVDRAKDRIREMEQADRRFSDEDLAGGAGGVGDAADGSLDLDTDEDDGVDLSFGKKGRSKGRGVAKAKRRSTKGQKKRRISKRSDENVYVFDDQDETRVAFDEFFTNPDPHLDKVRGFLLD